MALSDLLSIIALLVSIVSASGVYIAPAIREHFNRKAELRDKHKEQIVLHVLNPMISGITYFTQREILGYLSDGVNIPTEENLKRYIRKNFDFATSPQAISYSDIPEEPEWFDEVLYDDYKCHNKGLWQEIENSKAEINKKMPLHVEKRWGLIIEIHNSMKETVAKYVTTENDRTGTFSIGEEDQLISVSTKIALLKLASDRPEDYALDEFNTQVAGKGDIPNKIVEIVDDQHFKKEAEELLQIQGDLKDLLTDLRNKINREATSGAKLEGKCHYLGYENPECE